MTHERDIERLLDTWFSDGPTETPDRVIDAVADRIARQPQRSAWRLTRRHVPMNAYLKPLALVAATILVAFLGFNLVGGFKTSSDVAAPSPTSSATPSPSPSPSPSASTVAFVCADDVPGCAGPLTAGEHASRHFVVPFTFRTPEAWVNTSDIDRAYSLQTGAGIATPVQVMGMITLVDQDTTCGLPGKADVGNTVEDVVGYLQSHPLFTVSDPVPVEVGGYRGTSIDFSADVLQAGSCRWPTLLTDADAPYVRRSVHPATEQVRWDVLDVNGETVIIERVGASASGKFEEAAAAAQPIIDSIRFMPPN